jgi:hypothetical protein
MSRQLSEKDLEALRQRGLLRESETAFKDGSTIIAEDLVTKVRRILNVSGLMLEANQQILHD